MTPTVLSVLQRGYFPKELPPPFNTFGLGVKYTSISAKWQPILDDPTSILSKKPGESQPDFEQRKKNFKKEFKDLYSSSSCSKYSIAKGKLTRRYIGIPNPIHYISLTEKTLDVWDEIIKVITQSRYSQSKPIFQDSLSERNFTTSSRGVSEFIKQMLSASFDKKVELRLDLSKFYPTIYTHSIVWAILDKDKAKALYRKGEYQLELLRKSGDLDALLYAKAKDVDTQMRNCQDKQSIGIPIGSDISFLIAELIVSRIDIYLEKKFPEVTGCRYYDDYYLYLDSIPKAECVLKFIQEKLHEFGLEINEKKVSIKEFPFEFEEEFSANLSQFSFSKRFEQSVKLYFNLIWRFAKENPEKMGQIFRYSLKIFDPNTIDRIKIPAQNWSLFENLLYKTTILDPSILSVACNILSDYKPFLSSPSKIKLEKIVYHIFNEHIPLNQHLEISWALWVCKKFEIEISENIAVKIIKIRDSISTLILLDIIKNTQLIKCTSTTTRQITRLNKSFSDKSLFTEDWLLLYEGVKKGWLSRKDLIDNNYFFSILYDNDVEFYDPSNDADFTSSDYVFSRPELVITDEMKNKAKEKTTKILQEIIKKRVDEIIEEEKNENEFDSEFHDLFGDEQPVDTESLRKDIEDEIKKDHLENEIYHRVLSDIIHTEPLDTDEIIRLYLSKLKYYSMYIDR